LAAIEENNFGAESIVSLVFCRTIIWAPPSGRATELIPTNVGRRTHKLAH